MLSIANLNALKAYFGCFTSCEKHHIGQNEKSINVNLLYFKLRLFKQPEFLVLNTEILF